jgi:hypothetical protein
MTIAGSITAQTADTIVIAGTIPAEVQDSGKVRIGAALHHVNWITWEILHLLSGALQSLPGAGG